MWARLCGRGMVCVSVPETHGGTQHQGNVALVRGLALLLVRSSSRPGHRKGKPTLPPVLRWSRTNRAWACPCAAALDHHIIACSDDLGTPTPLK